MGSVGFGGEDCGRSAMRPIWWDGCSIWNGGQCCCPLRPSGGALVLVAQGADDSRDTTHQDSPQSRHTTERW